MYREDVKPGEASVVTVTDIPAEFTVGPLPEWFNVTFHAQDVVKITYILEVELRYGSIQPLLSSSKDWVRYIQPARDRHEQNVSLYKTGDGKFYLNTIRYIHRGEHLRVWYSDGMAREYGVPILFLNNIKGSRCYVCVNCGKEFIFPNSLKSHLMFRCLWVHSETLLETDNLEFQVSVRPFWTKGNSLYKHNDCVRFQSTRCVPLKNILTIQAQSTIQSRPERQSALSSETKFFLYDKSNLHVSPEWPSFHSGWYTNQGMVENQNIDMSSSYERMVLPKWHGTQNLHSYEPKRISPATYHRLILNNQTQNQGMMLHHAGRKSSISPPTNDEDKSNRTLEKPTLTLSSGQGHLCVYCGRYYSRKYGLKIHLRTHTGYKPLKCKICFRAFGDPSNLNKHVRLHSDGETPYRCSQCGKIFVRRRDRERHIKSKHL